MRHIIASGYFDPLHVGHLDLLEQAKQLAGEGEVVVIINSDAQARSKKGYVFMQEEDRARIVCALSCVDCVVTSTDTDGTVVKTLAELASRIRERDADADLYFVNGGDRHNKEIPEAAPCEEYSITIIDGLGEKIRSSSELVANAPGAKDRYA